MCYNFLICACCLWKTCSTCKSEVMTYYCMPNRLAQLIWALKSGWQKHCSNETLPVKTIQFKNKEKKLLSFRLQDGWILMKSNHDPSKKKLLSTLLELWLDRWMRCLISRAVKVFGEMAFHPCSHFFSYHITCESWGSSFCSPVVQNSSSRG